ncbi:SDR family oxidoreductase [Streptomyces sp. N2A]|uniref:SDR family oxidoreductase n=1 Tax=Streptomyces sp. N2A TaxID=3073936 RepID=UPI002870A374|nr:SDR family oxidoreductase [Streptomyces sp. N2A]
MAQNTQRAGAAQATPMARAGHVGGTATAHRPTLPAPATRSGQTPQTAAAAQEAREGGAAPRKVAVVTGAGSGIGRAVAQALMRANWSVALAGRRAEALAETARLAGLTEPTSPAVVTVPTDVTRPEQVDALFAAVRDRFGQVDLLFNNAGTFGKAVPLTELSYDDWRAVVEVNLTGAFLCAQAAFRTMQEQEPQGGRIINNGSISAHVPRPHSVAYTATKHAITGLTKSLSLDGRPYRIACGQIDIGNAATEMTGRMQTGILQANGQTAVEPVMDAADVARTVVHMAELPLEANVQFATVMATTMPYIGRG